MVENIILTNKAISKHACAAYSLLDIPNFRPEKDIYNDSLIYPKDRKIGKLAENNFKVKFLQMLG